MTTALAEQDLTDRVEETATAATQCGERVKQAEQAVVELEQKHAALLLEVSTSTARIVAGDQSDVDLTDLAAQAGDIARGLVEARNSLAESERQHSAARLAANKAMFAKIALEAEEVRTKFHASYRATCLEYGRLIEDIARLASLANSCRMPAFGPLAEHKNLLADLQSETSLNPLKHLLNEFEVTNEMQMGDVARLSSLYCPPLVPKIIKKRESTMTDISQLRFYGRWWQLDIKVPAANGGNTTIITVSSSAGGSDSLRVSFDVYQVAFAAYWHADIAVWNLDEPTTALLLGPNPQSVEVVLQAGYQNGSQGVIWAGPLFQPLFERVDAINSKLTLHCMVGLTELTRNFVNQSFAAEVEQLDLVKAIASQSFTPIPIDQISSKIAGKKLPRGQTCFGSPAKYFAEIAYDNDVMWWLGRKGLAMGGFNDDDIPTTPDLVFSPPQLPAANTAGPVPASKADGVIVGTPQQTSFGVSFRVLLDARIEVRKPFQVIRIDNSQIRQQKLLVDPSQNGPAKISVLDADGTYIVGAVRFSGDTRGQDWYADVDGYSTYLGKQHLLQAIMAAGS